MGVATPLVPPHMNANHLFYKDYHSTRRAIPNALLTMIAGKA
jgi:hypothetical protein